MRATMSTSETLADAARGAADAARIRRVKAEVVLRRRRARKEPGGGSGPLPFIVVGAALVFGFVAAKLLDRKANGD